MIAQTKNHILLCFHITLYTIAWIACSTSGALAVTVLFPATDAATPTGGEVYRINLIEALPGHTVLLADETDPGLALTAEISDVVYINSETNSSAIKDILRDTCIGVVIEEGQLVDDFGIASRAGTENHLSIEITDNSHPITSSFATGNLPIFTTTQALNNLEGTIAPAATANTLGTHPSEPDRITLTYMEIGDALYDTGVAAGRRVLLPWGAKMGATAISTLTPDGETLMHNAILWAEAAKGCKQLVKRAYLPDGTQLSGDGSETLPRGATIQFMIYFNNPDAAQTDVEVQDILEPTFAYQATSMRTTTMAACTNLICDAAEEQTIYNTVVLAGLRTDNPDGALPGGDEVSYTSGTLTVEAGDRVNANLQLDVNTNTLWALLFEAKIAQ